MQEVNLLNLINVKERKRKEKEKLDTFQSYFILIQFLSFISGSIFFFQKRKEERIGREDQELGLRVVSNEKARSFKRKKKKEKRGWLLKCLIA